MAPKCYICKYYDPKKMSLYRIPNRNDEYSERGKVWLKLLSAKKKDVDQIRICSLHFLKKKPSKDDNYLDVDWVPNKNLGKYSKNWKSVEYFIRQKNASRHEKANNQEFYVNPPQVLEERSPNCISLATAVAAIHKPINENPETSIDAINLNGESSRRLSMSSQFPLKKRKLTEIIEEVNFVPKEIQKELTLSEIDLLFEYYQRAIDERDELLLKLSTVLMDFNYFKGNDRKTRFFTGLPNWKLLSRFFDLVKNFIPTHFNCKLSQFQMMVLTLMKLRLNATFIDLGYRFQIDGSTASKTFHRCILILFKKFKNSKIIHWPEERNTLIFSTPSYFRSIFKETVTVIIDCFEIFCERCSNLRATAQLFSFYKHHVTLKYLIGISMSGVIIFISKAFGGRTSDKEATIQSGFLDHIQEGDLVLADKGFLIRHEVNVKNAHLKLPCFVSQGNQLHPTELEDSRKNSSLRIHVERVINILRQKFNVCSDVAKMSAVSKQDDLFDGDLYDMIVFVCSCIVNICPSVVTSDFEI